MSDQWWTPVVEMIAPEIDPDAWAPLSWVWPPRSIRKAVARRRARSVLNVLVNNLEARAIVRAALKESDVSTKAPPQT